MILRTIVVGPLEVNCYIIARDKGCEAIIIDPGADERKITKSLAEDNLTPAFIVNTHGHYDHIGCDDKFNTVVYCHSADAALLKDPEFNLSGVFSPRGHSVKAEIRQIEEDAILEAEGLRLKALSMPGHTPGGLALLMLEPSRKIVFTGDSLFRFSVGRSDLAGGDAGLLIKSIKEKLLVLDDDTIVYPGHGPRSTIGEEKKGNPFL